MSKFLNFNKFCKNTDESAFIDKIIATYVDKTAPKSSYYEKKKMISYLSQSLIPYIDKDNDLYDSELLYTKDEKINVRGIWGYISQPFDQKSWEKYRKIEKERLEADKNKKLEPNTTLKCSMCGGGVFYSEYQTRSADEGATKYYSCVKCGNNWKK